MIRVPTTRMLIAFVLALAVWPAQTFAAVAYGNAGSGVGGTTTLNLPYPASLAAGDLLVICVTNKYPTDVPTLPSGWTAPSNNQGSGGSGAPGEDSGTVTTTVFVKEATGGESGSLSLTITNGNSSVAQILRFTKGAGAWNYATANGPDNTTGVSWSVTMGTDPGVAGGDVILMCNGGSANDAFSAHAISQAGITYGAATERTDTGSSGGDHVWIGISTHAVTSGTSSAAPVYTATVVNGTAGAGVFLRLREDAAVANTPQGFGWFLGTQ